MKYVKETNSRLKSHITIISPSQVIILFVLLKQYCVWCLFRVIWCKIAYPNSERFRKPHSEKKRKTTFQNKYFIIILSGKTTDHTFHLTFTCSKSTIETLEKGVKYVQS